MRLLVIRHGESEADLLDVHEGRADFPLTERGHRQAEAMAQFVKENYTVTAIYCSTLKRAYQTCVHLSEATGIPIIPDDKLMEFDNGLLAGIGRKEAYEQYPLMKRTPVHTSVYEQESALEFRFRADYILSKIMSENAPNAVIAIVSHGGMINQLYRSFFHLPVDSNMFFSTGDTGIHNWYIEGTKRRILFANYTAHTVGI